jgi:hypothetical protein
VGDVAVRDTERLERIFLIFHGAALRARRGEIPPRHTDDARALEIMAGALGADPKTRAVIVENLRGIEPEERRPDGLLREFLASVLIALEPGLKAHEAGELTNELAESLEGIEADANGSEATSTAPVLLPEGPAN